MQIEAPQASALPSESSILLRILLPYSMFAGATLIIFYLGGIVMFEPGAPLWIAFGWTYAATVAFFLEYGRILCVPPRNSIGYRALFIFPAAIQFSQDMLNMYWYWSYSTSLLRILFSGLDIGLAILAYNYYVRRIRLIEHSQGREMLYPKIPSYLQVSNRLTRF